MWDDAALASLEVPLANARYSPVHFPSDYYYRIPVRTIYRTYPVYAPGQEHRGYIDELKQKEPEIVFDSSTLKTEADWIKAGEACLIHQSVDFRTLPDPSAHLSTAVQWQRWKTGLTRDATAMTTYPPDLLALGQTAWY